MPALGVTEVGKDTDMDALKSYLLLGGGECLVLNANVPAAVTKGDAVVKAFSLDDKHCMLRRQPGNVTDVAEVRVAVVGNVDAGKSTMLGVLTKGVLDDGRGRARASLFRHKHEHDSGRTSSIGQELIGFTAEGQAIRPPAPSTASATHHHVPAVPWSEVCARSAKVVSFMDLAGHERYLKTTMFGLTGGAPDYALLMVGANAGMIGMSKEHMTLAFGVGVPLIVVVTKVDICPPSVRDDTIRQISRLLKSHQRIPLLVKSPSDVVFSLQQFQAKQHLCPLFLASNVTGAGVDLVEMMLNVLPVPQDRYVKNAPTAEFYITDTYSVPGAGTVVAGTMISGSIGLGQTLHLGPDSTGAFTPVTVKGVQRKRVNVQLAEAGQCVSFALKRVKRSAIRRGMVLLSHPDKSGRTVREFSAEVIILFHSTTISPRYQAMLHCGVIRQTVAIVDLPESVLRTGDRATVRFRFLRSPEYLRVGQRLLFREGRTKGVGRVVELHE